jgi:hypothetical protein
MTTAGSIGNRRAKPRESRQDGADGEKQRQVEQRRDPQEFYWHADGPSRRLQSERECTFRNASHKTGPHRQ